MKLGTEFNMWFQIKILKIFWTMIRLETHFWGCYGSQINENDNKFTSYWYIYICQKKKKSSARKTTLLSETPKSLEIPCKNKAKHVVQ